jgi:hypothetical protein
MTKIKYKKWNDLSHKQQSHVRQFVDREFTCISTSVIEVYFNAVSQGDGCLEQYLEPPLKQHLLHYFVKESGHFHDTFYDEIEDSFKEAEESGEDTTHLRDLWTRFQADFISTLDECEATELLKFLKRFYSFEADMAEEAFLRKQGISHGTVFEIVDNTMARSEEFREHAQLAGFDILDITYYSDEHGLNPMLTLNAGGTCFFTAFWYPLYLLCYGSEALERIEKEEKPEETLWVVSWLDNELTELDIERLGFRNVEEVSINDISVSDLNQNQLLALPYSTRTLFYHRKKTIPKQIFSVREGG